MPTPCHSCQCIRFVNARLSVPRDGWTPSSPARASAAPPIPSCAHPRPRYGVRAASWTRPGNWPGPLRIGWHAPSRSTPYPIADPVLAGPRRLANPASTDVPDSPAPAAFSSCVQRHRTHMVAGLPCSTRSPPYRRPPPGEPFSPHPRPFHVALCASGPLWSPGCCAPPSVRRAGVDCARAFLSLQSAYSTRSATDAPAPACWVRCPSAPPRAGQPNLAPHPALRPALPALVPGVVQVVAPSSALPRLELLTGRLRPGGILQPFLYLRTEIGLPYLFPTVMH